VSKEENERFESEIDEIRMFVCVEKETRSEE